VSTVNGRHVLLDKWCVTTRSPGIAVIVVQQFGGEPTSDPTNQTGEIEVRTEAVSIEMILDHPSDIAAGVILAADDHLTPYVTVEFRLARAPDLGRFRFSSGSWDLAAKANQLAAELAHAAMPTKGRLRLVKARYPRPDIEIEA